MRGAQGQAEALAGTFQPVLIGGVQAAVLAQAGQVEKGIGHALALDLALPGARHQGGAGGCVGTFAGQHMQGGGFPGHRHMQVDAVEQWPRELAAVALDLFGAAATAAAGVAKKAARAGVHRRYQLEPRGKAHLVTGPGDDDLPTFQGLAQHLQHLAVELGQLIQKQYALMGQGDFPRLRPAAATDQGRAGGAVMRVAKGPLRPGIQRGVTGHRMNRRDFQGFLLVEWRQQTGQAAGQQGLAGAWRTGQQQVMLLYTKLR